MPGHGSIAPILDSFRACEVQDAKIFCKDRWPKLYRLLVAFKFKEAKEQVERWIKKGILTEAGSKVLEEIENLVKQKPSTVG